jgi:hypothetical protein
MPRLVVALFESILLLGMLSWLQSDHGLDPLFSGSLFLYDSDKCRAFASRCGMRALRMSECIQMPSSVSQSPAPKKSDVLQLTKSMVLKFSDNNDSFEVPLSDNCMSQDAHDDNDGYSVQSTFSGIVHGVECRSRIAFLTFNHRSQQYYRAFCTSGGSIEQFSQSLQLDNHVFDSTPAFTQPTLVETMHQTAPSYSETALVNETRTRSFIAGCVNATPELVPKSITSNSISSLSLPQSLIEIVQQYTSPSAIMPSIESAASVMRPRGDVVHYLCQPCESERNALCDSAVVEIHASVSDQGRMFDIVLILGLDEIRSASCSCGVSMRLCGHVIAVLLRHASPAQQHVASESADGLIDHLDDDVVVPPKAQEIMLSRRPSKSVDANVHPPTDQESKRKLPTWMTQEKRPVSSPNKTKAKSVTVKPETSPAKPKPEKRKAQPASTTSAKRKKAEPEMIVIDDDDADEVVHSESGLFMLVMFD